MNARPIVFEDFTPGQRMGESVEVYDEQQARRWQSIFASPGADADQAAAEAASMAVVNMMRAFLHVVTPRPPGNVHARQQLSLQALPSPGEAIRVVVTCADKQVRRERRYVELEVGGTGAQGRSLFTGRLHLVWAA